MKTIFIAALATMTILVSCQKDDSYVDPQSDELVFTASITTSDTKTTINADKNSADKGKIYWVKDDEITVKDAKGNTAVYVAQTGSSTSTTFKIKTGEKSLGSGPYTATYGTAPSTSQSYSDYYSKENVAKELYMTAPSTDNKSFTFTAACGLMKINLTSSDASDKTISKIEVFGTPTEGEYTVYTLTCSNIDITSPKDFFIALPAGSYTVLKFTNSTGHICFKTAKSAITIEDNMIQPVTLTGIVFDDMLPGKFSVALGKQVRFSKGNLYWDGSYHFESNQYDYTVVAQGTNPETYKWDPSHICHFFWTNWTDYNSGTASYMPYAESYNCSSQSTSDKFFCGEDNKLTVDGVSSCYALSYDKWIYLLNNRTSASSLLKHEVSVAGKSNCLVIAPDGYSGTIESEYDTKTWAIAESTGLVCLPAVGYRDVSNYIKQYTVYGNYWSSTPDKDDEYFFLVYGIDINKSTIRANTGERGQGCSVRLVR